MTSTSDSVDVCSGTLIYFYGGDAVVDQTPSEIKRLWDEASDDEMIELSIDGVEAFVLKEDLGAMFPTFKAVEMPGVEIFDKSTTPTPSLLDEHYASEVYRGSD